MELFIIKIFKRIGLVVARQSTVNRDAELIRDKYIKIGRDIGILEVLRYNQKSLSAAKFQESAQHFDFEGLDAKYPYNPLLENPHGKERSTP
jgi:hypothetical protein